MRPLRMILAVLLVLLALGAGAAAGWAQSYDEKQFSEMRWRMIGPYRGGRTRAASGVPSQPNVFYIGAGNGGVWRTTDYGRTWQPIFDREPTGSIGAIVVAPSDPSIIYVGTGEGLNRPDLATGDGMYKSTDGGATWTHLGLRDSQQIPYVSVDPRNPDRLFVAALGHPYGPNAERGIYRSTDGGKTFDKVLGKDENTGGSFVEIDPANPQVVYASLWEERQGPWENGAWGGTGGGLFKSTDGGTTWRQLTSGLPAVVQANVAISRSNPNRLYAAVAGGGQGPRPGTGIYRSDDAGETWVRTTTDTRPGARIGGGDVPLLAVDPRNPDIVYVDSTVTWKSTDAGRTWTGLRGAPGGDDYQHIWINPDNPAIMLIASDQGAIITVNGGQTWSSWYTQPTAAMYHVAADNAFPYRLCSGQQDSGSACVSSRGNDGQITMREWHPVGVEEYGYAAPDPLDPDVVYGGKVTRYDRRTGQVQNVAPTPIRPADFRALRTQPVIFSPKDPHILYFASNTLWKTTDGGQSWQRISPDLTRKTWEIPASVGKYRDQPTAQPTQRGVIYAVGASPLDVNRIWAGTDDGLIQVTSDGGRTWKDVTPPQMTPFAKVSILDAGHFDALTAYAAINTFRLDDLRPHILRTHDGGKTWTEITNGIANGAPINVVREDPQRKGLLFAGSETQVWVSFDDGDHWQSLRLNLPAISIRDLIIKDDDVAVGTHGRGFWILDDITPLRQLKPAAGPVLYKPQRATRVRWNMNTDTPLPPDEPGGQNPPDGAILNYYLPSGAQEVTLEIRDAAGKLVRRYSSKDPAVGVDPATLAVPVYWARPPKVLSAEAGFHRWLWDLHYTSLSAARNQLPMQAIAHDTAPAPLSPWVMPGQYTAKLTVDGKSYTQPLTVRMDPRVKTPVLALQQQFTLSKQMYDDIVAADETLAQIQTVRQQLESVKPRAQGAVAEAITAYEQKLTAIGGATGGGRGGPGGGGGGGGRGGAPGAPETIASVRGALTQLMNLLEGADRAPTTQAAAAAADRRKAMSGLQARWSTLSKEPLTQLNEQLRQAGLPAVTITVHPRVAD
jgi:photosystem II stability/assembly factor-like uncharacterized protein